MSRKRERPATTDYAELSDTDKWNVVTRLVDELRLSEREQEKKDPLKRILLRFVGPLFREFGNDLVLEYFRFLSFKRQDATRDRAQWRYGPSGPVDAVWHYHILMTKEYHDFCHEFTRHRDRHDKVVSQLIHHTPESARGDDRDVRYEHTYNSYVSVYGAPPETWWPKVKREMGPRNVTVQIHTMTGKVIPFNVNLSQYVLELMQQYHDKEGIPLDQQRMIYHGRQMEEMEPLHKYMKGSVEAYDVHMVLKLSGC